MKILLADDEPVGRTVLASWLKSWGYEPVVVTNGSEAVAALKADPELKLAIVDWMMPELDGLEVCRQVRAGDGEYVYIVLLTSRDRTEDLVEGLEAGADDYLVKPCNRQELDVRLRTGRRILKLQAELISAREQLRVRAMYDGMTGLLNRSAFLERMRMELSRSEREHHPLGVLMIDLDHFKSVNDTYGHAAGDAVLTETARRVTQVLRPYDVVGRLGGEEFAVLLPQCSAEQVERLGQRVLNAIRGEPISAGRVTLEVTASIGACSTEQSDERVPEALLAAADSALYRAKHQGRNRVERVVPMDLPQIGSIPRIKSLSPTRCA